MELYNSIIEKVGGMLGSAEPKRYAYDPGRTWEDAGGNQLIMMKESAYELGGDSRPAVNYACVTSSDGFADEDEILVYGKDLGQISDSVPFARIAIVKVNVLDGEGEEDTEPLFRAIQDIDFVKYHVYPKGYMIRSSSDSYREQVRVSRDAVRKGISFRALGANYIAAYKQDAYAQYGPEHFADASRAAGRRRFPLLHDLLCRRNRLFRQTSIRVDHNAIRAVKGISGKCKHTVFNCIDFCSKAPKIPQTSHLNAAALRACLPLVFCFQTEPAVNACSCNLRTRIHTI